MPIEKTEIESKILRFYKKNDIFKKPIERIINVMKQKCTYINGESIERHIFGNESIKLKNIPKDINSIDFERELLKSLDHVDNDKSIIELLWGDIQLGKRIQACIIMWISVYILKRPVIYIFRNLKIDQKQLDSDIRGANEYDFNIQYIKKYFDKYISEEIEQSDWKDFKLPELKDINNESVIDNVSNKDSLNPTDIFCCLMNYTQLEKINVKLNEYICNNEELMNVTLIVDESDLYAPTSSNNGENNNDLKDSTKCEQLLAKIYKKVRYVLHITGTAHSLLYNVTTKLTDLESIQIPISKVHKMKRIDDYFGLFNDKIKYETDSIKEWWNEIDATNRKKKYTLHDDYNINIKNIIKSIRNRPQDKYHSFLISEEKIRVNHHWLAKKILNDFTELFVIIFHGKCLRLYLPKLYEKDLKYYSKQEKRLYKYKGIYGESHDNDMSEKLSNDYCYFDICSKLFNLKQIYKLLAILFKEYDMKFRTVITITGKYGERGYSFTSDNYDKYQFHLTDQYFPCHVKNKNCTDISQRLRLQGKYSDHPTLTLWTSNELKDIIVNFFVPFMKEIEKEIMECNCWIEIKDLIECIICQQGNINCSYMKYIDARKKNKNWMSHKHFEKKHNGFRLFKIDNMSVEDIGKKINKLYLPKYLCINTIMTLPKEEFIQKYGDNKIEILFENIDTITEFNKENINNIIMQQILKYNKKNSENIIIKGVKKKWINKRLQNKYNNKFQCNMRGKLDIYNKDYIISNKHEGLGKKSHENYRINLFYDKEKLHIAIRFKTNNKVLPLHRIDFRKIPFYEEENGKIKFTLLKSKYKNKTDYGNEDGNTFISDALPNTYYWKTPDGWVFFYDKKNNIMSIKILEPIKTQIIENEDTIKDFVDENFKNAEKKNIRIGINEIMNKYKIWCKNKKIKTRTELKKSLEILGYTEETMKGVDINGKSGKRGYNIMLNI